MKRLEDPFIEFATEIVADDFAALTQRKASLPQPKFTTPPTHVNTPTVCRLHGFDLEDQPLLSNVAIAPGQILTARSTLPLLRAIIGKDVVVLFDGGNPQFPIIMGVIESRPLVDSIPKAEPGVTVQADGERHVVNAEREIVLRCGDASITLTRAGKVIIKGNYILSRSTGYNKIKGAAIDIN
jgi:Domain of unknown function (DUF6484)